MPIFANRPPMCRSEKTVMEIRPTESEEFVSRINGKVPAAWEELYDRYYKALCAYSASLTGDAAFAEDLVQELLLRMWQSDRIFSVLPELAAYLYRSVYHNSLAYRRDRSNRESLLRRMHEQSLRDGNSPPLTSIPRRSPGSLPEWSARRSYAAFTATSAPCLRSSAGSSASR